MSDGEAADRRELPPTDARRVQSLAVHTDDVLTALEARERRRRPAVLRITPPYNGRMRARLHVEGGEGTYPDSDRPVHLSPHEFVEDVPPFPDVDETEDRLREQGAYDVERHREAHAAAVDDWRDAVRAARRETVTFETPDGPHEVRIAYLG